MSSLVKTPAFPALRSMLEGLFDSEKLFDKSFFRNDTLPAVNVRETGKHYKIDLAVPGFKKEDFKINLENGILSISAETKKEKEKEEENYTRREFSHSSFVRSFSLPDDVKQEDISAKYEDGMLKVVLGKAVGNRSVRKEISVL